MYNIAFTGNTAVTISTATGLDHCSQIVLQTVSVLWGSFFCSLAFVLPRLLQAQKVDYRPVLHRSSAKEQSTLTNNQNVAVALNPKIGKKSCLSFPSATWSTQVDEQPCIKIPTAIECGTELQGSMCENDDRSKELKSTDVSCEEDEILFEYKSTCDSIATE